ncbi:MAG TPA: hypothetical protein VF017_16475 [Thermoanaerobaculia bacterium]|nr:hypothetical protein [Thermoanaerobaculia bacterium]
MSVDVDVDSTPPAEGECPDCDTAFSIDDIAEESGSETLTCETCNAELEVRWSDWGRQVEVDGFPPDDDDDDDDEDETEGEDGDGEDEEDDDEESEEGL